MKWYWIVLLAAYYLFMAGFTMVTLKRHSKDETTKPFCVLAGILWPIMAIALPFAGIILLIDQMTDKLM